jgi:hypothetical protein
MRALRSLTGALATAAVLVGSAGIASAQTEADTVIQGPIGVLDGSNPNAPGGLRLMGWAFEPGATEATRVVFTINGEPVGEPLVANLPRPDVEAVHGRRDVGFDGVVPVPGGTHNFCLRLVNQGAGEDRELACGTIDRNADPIGHVDLFRLAPGGVRVAGWTLDPDTEAPTSVRFMVGDQMVREVVADLARPDVAEHYEGFGEKHGYDEVIPLGDGTHTLCVWGVNIRSGTDTRFACGEVTRRASPVGKLDQVTTSLAEREVRVTGWVADPDTDDPIRVRVELAGESKTVVANLPRTDMDQASEDRYGTNRGFRAVMDMPEAVGTYPLCITALNVGAGSDTAFRCGTVTIS